MITTTNKHQFARSAPRAVAIGRRADSSPVSSATLNDGQMAIHSLGVGRSGFGSCVFPPVRFGQGRAHPRFAGYVQVISSRLTRLRYLGRGFALRSFFSGMGRDCSRSLANTYALDHAVNDDVQTLKAHSQVLVSVGPKPTQRGIHRVGPFTQGLGND